ncbi:hypothetical protein CERSUDRAFT_101198 [Gelatoporia subvermispora B]|uniref:Uncharacterized protein n=1 Tax=Ceriporiopsis subvermispora (strain B) TaxID=914234 RepID=M2P5S0_CERS8|nr:hypothetical protein CERSUDRAFT_101198 [Gelatoporia subvermispora B]
MSFESSRVTPALSKSSATSFLRCAGAAQTEYRRTDVSPGTWVGMDSCEQRRRRERGASKANECEP